MIINCIHSEPLVTYKNGELPYELVLPDGTNQNYQFSKTICETTATTTTATTTASFTYGEIMTTFWLTMIFGLILTMFLYLFIKGKK